MIWFIDCCFVWASDLISWNCWNCCLRRLCVVNLKLMVAIIFWRCLKTELYNHCCSMFDLVIVYWSLRFVQLSSFTLVFWTCFFRNWMWWLILLMQEDDESSMFLIVFAYQIHNLHIFTSTIFRFLISIFVAWSWWQVLILHRNHHLW